MFRSAQCKLWAVSAVSAWQVDKNEFFCHPVLLGDNLYNKDRPKVLPPPRGRDTHAEKAAAPVQQAAELSTHDDGKAGRVSPPTCFHVLLPSKGFTSSMWTAL